MTTSEQYKYGFVIYLFSAKNRIQTIHIIWSERACTVSFSHLIISTKLSCTYQMVLVYIGWVSCGAGSMCIYTYILHIKSLLIKLAPQNNQQRTRATRTLTGKQHHLRAAPLTHTHSRKPNDSAYCFLICYWIFLWIYRIPLNEWNFHFALNDHRMRLHVIVFRISSFSYVYYTFMR